ncbi:MAG: UDP-glucose 4-epimerase GalE [Gammaproteobacteria bacterium]|nr:MAG: UDP-glucose 4-epimerase GalE [Gammaproteobacteria bacterium]
MKVLVCGGAGYIASHMCKMLARAGHDVLVFDNLSTGHREAVQWGEFIEGDLLNPGDLEQTFSSHQIDAVMHFSAKSLVGESVEKPALYYRNNVTGTLNLLDAMMAHQCKIFIFSSTAAVFGNPSYTPIDEAHVTVPINPYGQTKLMVEHILKDYDHAYGLKNVSLRYFNAAGADNESDTGELHDPETHLIPNILLSLLVSGKSLCIFGEDYDTPDGTCVRDYIHVEDLCDAHMKALDYLDKGGNSDIFNLGNGNGFSVKEVIAAAEKITGQKITYTMEGRRVGDPPVLTASSEKARKILGWQPKHTDLNEIVASAWHWHQKQHQAQ